MAVLALGLLGGAIGSSIGGAIGGTLLGIAATTVGFSVGASLGSIAGSFVDQTFVYPAIFGSDKQTLYGPRIDDFQFTLASPGTPLPFILGRENRIPGLMIWQSAVREEKHEEEVGGGGKGGGGGKVINYEYFVDFAIALCEGEITALRRIWADGQIIYDNPAGGAEKLDDRYESITFYPGSDDQLPDPTIESHEGAGNVPAFRGVSYYVVTNFSLTSFGNRFPNFNHLCEKENQTLLSEAFDSILSRSGKTSDNWDVIWLQGEEVRGYVITGPQVPIKVLEPLMLTYNVVAQEIDGVINFRPRQYSQIIDIAEDKLSAGEDGQEAPRKITFVDKPGFDLPQRVQVNYIDVDFNFQKNGQQEVRQIAVSPTTSTVDLPIAMDGSFAKSLARRFLWSSWAERTEVSFTLPPSQLAVLESDLLNVPVNGEGYLIRVTSITRGHNFIHEVKGVLEQQHTLTLTAVAEIPIIDTTDPQETPVAISVAMDIPILPDQETPHRRLYFATALESQNSRWQGIRTYLATSPEGTWYDWLTIKVEATLGKALNALSDIGPSVYWDRVSYLDVRMYEGKFVTKTEQEVLAGANHVFVQTGTEGAGEIVAFCNAQLIADGTYRLSKLLRGRRDTTDQMDGHAINDRVVALDQIGVYSKSYDQEAHNEIRYILVSPRGSNHDDLIPLGPILRTSRGLRPFAPWYTKIKRESDDDLVVTWLRRSRLYFRMFALNQEAPLGAAEERYDVSFYDQDTDALLRIKRVSSETATYTAAEQTADGYTPGGNLRVSVCQLNSDIAGLGTIGDSPSKGNCAEAFYPPLDEPDEPYEGVLGSGYYPPSDDEDTSFNVSLLGAWFTQGLYPGKKVIDCSFYSDQPDLRSGNYNFETGYLAYDGDINRAFGPPGDPNSYPDLSDPTDAARKKSAYRKIAVAASGSEIVYQHSQYEAAAYESIQRDYLIFDVESGDYLGKMEAAADMTVRQQLIADTVTLMEEVIDEWSDESITGIKLGFFFVPPPLSNTILSEFEDFSDLMDAFFPEVYVHSESLEDYIDQLELRLLRCYQQDPSKPVYVFLAPHYAHFAVDAIRGLPIPSSYWKQIVDAIMDRADGIVIWGGLDNKLGGDPATPLPWVDPVSV